MNVPWEIKAFLLGMLSRAPHGRYLYRRLQDIFGTTTISIRDYERSRAILTKMHDSGIGVENARVLEIGTGWHPVMPILLYLLGSKSVTTIDINPWLSRESLSNTITLFQELIERLVVDFGMNYENVAAKMEVLRKLNEDFTLSVTDILMTANIEYICPVDATQSPFEDESFDHILSINVFQSIPPSILSGILSESRRILKNEGWHIHHIYTGDPFAFDKRITSVNFLRYTPATWHWIGGSGLAYNNRLRCIDYIRLFREYSFEIKCVDTKLDNDALKALNSGKVKPSVNYQGYCHEDLSCSSIDIFAVCDGSKILL